MRRAWSLALLLAAAALGGGNSTGGTPNPRTATSQR